MMTFAGPHNVVVIVDGPDPDNFACILAATSKWARYNVVAVIMTGRPVSAAQGAKPYEFNPAASRAVNRDNALHAKGMLMRHGRGHIPVFEGLRAPYATLEHKIHIRERVTDIYDDAHAGHRLAGTIDDAVVYLASLPGTLHFVCGGPLTDLAYLLYQPMLQGKFGVLTAQLGMFGFTKVKTLSGGRKQFNVIGHAKAVHDVSFDYPGPMYINSTDLTKLPEIGMNSAEVLARLAKSSGFHEIVDMYRAAWPHMWGKIGIDAHVHDFHPAEMMKLLFEMGLRHHQNFSPDGDTIGRYTVQPVGIAHVPYLPNEQERWGEIDLGPVNPGGPLRFLATGIDTSRHWHILAQALNSPAFVGVNQYTHR